MPKKRNRLIWCGRNRRWTGTREKSGVSCRVSKAQKTIRNKAMWSNLFWRMRRSAFRFSYLSQLHHHRQHSRALLTKLASRTARRWPASKRRTPPTMSSLKSAPGGFLLSSRGDHLIITFSGSTGSSSTLSSSNVNSETSSVYVATSRNGRTVSRRKLLHYRIRVVISWIHRGNNIKWKSLRELCFLCQTATSR